MVRAIKNIRLFDPAEKRDEIGTLIIEAGFISAIGTNIPIPHNAEIIEGSNLVLFAGIIDMHVFIGEPGEEYRETLATASQAAAAGGVTSIIMMPNTQPVIDNVALVDYISRRARDTALVHIYPTAAITKCVQGDKITEFGLLREMGAIAFTDGDQTIMNALLMSRAMKYATNFDALIMHHTMDKNLASAGVMHEGELATRLGLPSIPTTAETIILERDIRLVALTGVRYHASQISNIESIAIMRSAKQRNLPVTCGVSIHHLMLNQNDVADYRTFAKLNPPLRSEDDRQALIEAVADGTIDVIVSAHNPQDEDTKRRPFEEAAYGSIGIETLLPSALSLLHNNSIPLNKLMTALTTAPADILGLKTARLSIGYPADLVLVDLEKPWVVDTDILHSKSKNSVIEGHRLQGKVIETIVNGKTIYKHK